MQNRSFPARRRCSVIVRRAAERFLTESDGVRTWYSFSYGRHYDPENVGFGPIMAINEEQLAPGAGYDDHRHADADIVTWVLEGVLAHEDSTGQRGLIAPGVAQRLSAGEGVTHAERNASETEPLRFVQMMLRSSNWGAPQYAQTTVPDGAGLHETVPVHAAARLLVARPDGSLSVEAPAGALVHVTRGEIGLNETVLTAGDEVRLAAADALNLTGEPPAEALVWILTEPER